MLPGQFPIKKKTTMKLIWCPACEDVVKLRRKRRTCYCGKAYGRYDPDGSNARIGGTAIPIGFNNATFLDALKERMDLPGMGNRFEAFVIPTVCNTIKEYSDDGEKIERR